MSERKKSIVLSYISQAFGIISGIIYTPFILRILGQSEYGLYSLVASTISTLSILSFGFAGCYLFFYNKAEKEEGEKGVARFNGIYMVVYLVIALACIIGGIFIFFNLKLVFSEGLLPEEYIKARIMIVLMTINLAVSMVNGVFTSYANAKEHFVFLHGADLLFSLAGLGLNVLVLLAGGGAVGLAAMALSATLARLVVNAFYSIKKLSMKISFHQLDYSLLKPMGAFTAFIFINQITNQINGQLDKVLLGRFCGTSVVAVYSIGSAIDCYYQQMGGTISSVFAPEINRVAAGMKRGVDQSSQNEKLLSIFIRVSRIQIMISFLVLTGFQLLGKVFVSLWAGNGYEEAYYIALGLMFAGTIDYCQTAADAIQRARNMHRFRSITFLLLALLNIAISIPLLKRFGALGAAMGTMIVRIIGSVIINWYYNSKMGMRMKKYWKECLGLFPPIVLMWGGGFIIIRAVSVASWYGLILFGSIYTLGYALLLWKFAMNREEKNIVLDICKKFHRK